MCIITFTVAHKCQPALGTVFVQGAECNTALYSTRSTALSTETGTTSGEARGEKLSPLLIIIITATIISGELKARHPPCASNLCTAPFKAFVNDLLVKRAGKASASVLGSQKEM